MWRSTHLQCARVTHRRPHAILEVMAEPDHVYRALLGEDEIDYVDLTRAEKKEVKDFFWPPAVVEPATSKKRQRSGGAGTSSADPVNI